ncbi:FecCD family ABC transporter permease [Humidisolicoccus flavus]|uniref:FecCD family ABC transporter permease n=1 Tax=Humidisolicoccus flavus TaxID=3111414 RepID=UPI00324C1CEB
MLLHRRTIIATLIALLCALTAGLIGLSLGDSQFSLGDSLGALFGQADEATTRRVFRWRFPRVAVALLGGAALGIAGAILQSLTKNPLGSPDIIGFNVGAYSGVLISLIVFGSGFGTATAGALIGGLLSALVIYFLAFRDGVQGFRLIVVGIGVSAMLTALNTYLLLRAQLDLAIVASIWGSGSVASTTMNDVVGLAIVVAIVVPIALYFTPRMRLIEMGDDNARALGVGVERSRLALLVLAIVLTAAVTAAAGPIAFIALSAPHIARALVGGRNPGLITSAAVGAMLLAASDVVARIVIAPGQLPVGVVTVCLGGAYLLWLLISATRKAAS